MTTVSDIDSSIVFAQVQAVLRRHWNQHNIQFGSSVGNHSDAMRSASYTASSITEVQGCYSIDGHSEHMNGKGFHDTDTSMLKSDSPFAWQHPPHTPALYKLHHVGLLSDDFYCMSVTRYHCKCEHNRTF